MTDDELINKITCELGSQKEVFISELQSRIYDYISSKSSSNCLTIVERKKLETRNVVWEPSKALDGYIPRFISFLRKKDYEGNELDSYLTDDIVNIVEKTYGEFVKENTNLIVKPIAEKLLSQKDYIDSIAGHAIDYWKGTIGSVLRQRLMRLLVHKIEDSISTNIVHASSSAVVATTSKIIATAATIPISKTMAIVLVKNMAIMLKGIIAKILASTAFKTMLAGMIKKMVATKIVVAIISLVGGAKIAGLSFSVAWIVALLIAGIIVHEYYTLPHKMAEKISENVSTELRSQFADLNKNVASGIVAELGTAALGTFASDVIKDISMKDIVDSL